MTHISNQLKLLRFYLNLKQKELSEISGIPLSTIQKLERLNRIDNSISRETLSKIATACNFKDEYILFLGWGYTQDKNPEFPEKLDDSLKNTILYLKEVLHSKMEISALYDLLSFNLKNFTQKTLLDNYFELLVNNQPTIPPYLYVLEIITTNATKSSNVYCSYYIDGISESFREASLYFVSILNMINLNLVPEKTIEFVPTKNYANDSITYEIPLKITKLYNEHYFPKKCEEKFSNFLYTENTNDDFIQTEEEIKKINLLTKILLESKQIYYDPKILKNGAKTGPKVTLYKYLLLDL